MKDNLPDLIEQYYKNKDLKVADLLISIFAESLGIEVPKNKLTRPIKKFTLTKVKKPTNTILIKN